MSKILVVAAHPDDETLGCGAVMAKHIAAGDDVYCLVMATNYRSFSIAEHFKKAMMILGVSKYKMLNLPDMELEKYPVRELSEYVESYILEIGVPDIVYTHCENDLSQDHRLTFLATITALRPVWDKVFSIYSFESPSSTEWSGHIFDAKMFVNINGFTGKMLDAFDCYVTEVKPYPHPRSRQSLLARAVYWGTYCGLEYATAFEVVREVR